MMTTVMNEWRDGYNAENRMAHFGKQPKVAKRKRRDFVRGTTQHIASACRRADSKQWRIVRVASRQRVAIAAAQWALLACMQLSSADVIQRQRDM